MSHNDANVINKIKFEIDRIRPKLALDGGDIQFINFKNGVVKVKLLGECATCSLAHLTMEHAIEATLVRKIPDVKKVINVQLEFIK